ncbi:phospholipid carrier-dependent glycosyltransferase [Pseudomonas sp. Marseille-QA0892]
MKFGNRLLGWPLLIGYFATVYLLGSTAPALWSPDELRYAEIAREIIATGDWVAPHFNGLLYFEKPILGHWFNAIAQLLFGENNFSVRVVSALAALGSAYCLSLMVRRERGRDQALLAAGIYLSMFLVIGLGTYSALDGLLNFWMTATFVAFYFALHAEHGRARFSYFALGGALCGAAVLTKGFLALALPVIVVAPYALWQRKLHTLLVYGWASVAAAFLVCLPWAIAIHREAPDFWNYFFWVEHVHRFFAKDAQHAEPIWFFMPLLPLATLPWTFAAFTSLARLRHDVAQPWVRYALLWAFVPFVFFSLSRGKLPTYILPCMAPIALLLSQGLTAAFRTHRQGLARASWLQAGVMASITLGILVAYLMGKLPLGDGERYKAYLLMTTLLVWAVCIAAASYARTLGAFTLAHMLAPAALFLAVGVAVPDRVIDGKQPDRFIQQIAPDIPADAVLIADNPARMSALNWYLKRDDVYMTGSRGEVSYGLSYPDARHRYIDNEALGSFIAEQRTHHPVVMLVSSLPDMGSDFPAYDRLVGQTRLQALFFDRNGH